MSDKEIKLMHACKQLDTKTTSYVAEASECGVTERHMRRVYAKWRLGGTAELIHKSRKKPGKRKIPEETIDTVISFIKNELPGYNPAHAQEACAEELGIVLSVPTVRKYMRERNIKTGSYRAKPVVPPTPGTKTVLWHDAPRRRKLSPMVWARVSKMLPVGVDRRRHEHRYGSILPRRRDP